MSSSQQTVQEKSLNRLVQYTQKNDFVKALVVAHKLLKQEQDLKANNDLKECILVLYLLNYQLDKAQEFALENKMQNRGFIKAYMDYLSRKNEQALRELNDDDDDDTLAKKHLKAQLLFRMGRHEEASKIYDRILAMSKNNNPSPELLSNVLASKITISSHEEDAKKIESILISSSTNNQESIDWEVYFNLATYYIHSKDFSQARKYLQKSEELSEIKPNPTIQTQLAFCEQQDGNSTAAEALYHGILEAHPTDPAVIGVATNNLLALRGNRDLFDAYKRFRVFDTNPDVLSRLAISSRINMIKNKLLLLASMQKKADFDDVATQVLKTTEDENEKKEYQVFVHIAQACMSYAKNKIEETISSLKQAIASTISGNECRLMLAQIFAHEKRYKEAIEQLELLSNDLRTSPGVLATIVYLKQASGDENASSAFLSLTTSDPDILLCKAQYLSKLGQRRESAAVYEQILEVPGLDLEKRFRILGELSSVTQDVDRLESLLQSIPHPEDEVFNLDELERFETGFSSQIFSNNKGSGTKSSSLIATDLLDSKKKVVSKEEKAKRKNHKREKIKAARKAQHLEKLKSKGIKDLDDHLKSLDPKRWIPMSKREPTKKTTRRVRNKDKKKKMTGPQGGVSLS